LKGCNTKAKKEKKKKNRKNGSEYWFSMDHPLLRPG
jgi:hypothetical protein